MQEPKLFPLWKQAVQDFIASDPQPGTVITEEWKAEHFGLRKPTNGSHEDFKKFQFEMLGAFEQFKSILLTEYQIYLKAAGNGSHVVLAPGEQTADAWNKRIREIGRSMNSLRNELLYVNVARLSADERKENANKQAKAAMMALMMRKARRARLPEIETPEVEG